MPWAEDGLAPWWDQETPQASDEVWRTREQAEQDEKHLAALEQETDTLRQKVKAPVPRPVDGAIEVKLTLDGDFSSFDELKKASVLSGLASKLGVPVSKLSIGKCYAGSVIVEVKIDVRALDSDAIEGKVQTLRGERIGGYPCTAADITPAARLGQVVATDQQMVQEVARKLSKEWGQDSNTKIFEAQQVPCVWRVRLCCVWRVQRVLSVASRAA